MWARREIMVLFPNQWPQTPGNSLRIAFSWKNTQCSALPLPMSCNPLSLLVPQGCCCNIPVGAVTMMFCDRGEVMTQQWIAAVFRAGTIWCQTVTGAGKVLHGGRKRESGGKCCFKHTALTRPRIGSSWIQCSNSSAPVSQITISVTCWQV